MGNDCHNLFDKFDKNFVQSGYFGSKGVSHWQWVVTFDNYSLGFIWDKFEHLGASEFL